MESEVGTHGLDLTPNYASLKPTRLDERSGLNGSPFGEGNSPANSGCGVIARPNFNPVELFLSVFRCKHFR